VSDAKITLTTEAKNDGLEKLNQALAEGQQSVASMQRELNDLTKATKAGTQATKEQADEMVRLRKEINQQKAANKEYASEIGKTTAEIKKSVKEMADADKGARGLAGAFKMTEGFTTAFSVAIGNLAANIAGAAVSAMADFAGQVVNLGAQMQQSVAHMSAMVGGTEAATVAYRALNDAYRDTNFQEDAVMNMGTQLMRLGYSAQGAADLIRLCADAAAGLGTGQQGAQQLVDALSRMQVTGELTSRQLTQLKLAGVDMDAAFKSLGMNGDEAMKAIKEGTLDNQKAIEALTNYLHQYDGKMAETKNNVIDGWGDVAGNMQTVCAEIGNSIYEAFNQSEIVQVLIDFTQSLVDMIRSDATGAFTDLKAIASEVLNFIGGLLGFVCDTIKLIIIAVHDAYAAFRSFGSQVVEAIRPAVDAVIALYNAVKAVMSSIGKSFGAEVGRSWQATFGTDPDDADSYAIASGPAPVRLYSGGGGGGGGGGSRSNSDAEAKRAEEKAKKEAEKAAQAAKKAYEDEFNDIFSAMQEDSKTLLSAFLGDPDSTKAKIQALKDQLIQDFEEIDKAAAMSENQGDLTPLAAILGKTPDELQAELEAKGQSLADFVEKYKEAQASAAEAQAKSMQTANTWQKTLVDYAKGVAGAMSDAMMDFIMGVKSGKEALADFLKSVLENALRILTQWLSLFAVYSLVGDPTLAARNASATLFGTNGGNVVLHKARGGYISGPGTGTSDSIPAMLSNGEYVLRSSAVDRIGIGTLNALNSGALQFANGGSVDAEPAGVGGGSNVTLNVSAVDAASFSAFLDRGGLDEIKQALYEDNRRFSSGVGVW